jgi:putative ABC transport system permease protein
MSLLAAQSVTLRRTSTILLASFALLALGLAAVGLYGVMAYSVVQRTHEIGLRVALGARKGDVLWLVLQEAMRVVVIGEVAGLLAAVGLAHAVSGLLYGVSPSDPRTLAATMAGLTLVALLASYLPARRAMNLDPMAALRRE